MWAEQIVFMFGLNSVFETRFIVDGFTPHDTHIPVAVDFDVVFLIFSLQSSLACEVNGADISE